ncbi:hypothetical protein L596_011343 [Steinernema carpocapsae]|uniref:BPTI/Kunitz inhibitor domain-containing protein n=1 Tax=Steinernema carpocapsae TaxID=34508 RepID=A0A4U5NTK3_STECR|nr:hypothetical protein L596_011343 [Steinernema carpocapsae]
MCPDGSDALLEGGAPKTCGTGSDGHEFCPKGFYCSINIESNSRLCCPLGGSMGSNIPPPPVIAPYFGRRLPNPGEVIDRGSLPSDPKPKPLSTPKPKAPGGVDEGVDAAAGEAAAGGYPETSAEAPAPVGAGSAEAGSAEGVEQPSYKGDNAVASPGPDEVVVEEKPTHLAGAAEVPAASMPGKNEQEGGPYGRMMLKPVNSHLKLQERELAQNEKLAASRAEAGIDVGSIDDPFDAAIAPEKTKTSRDATICFLRPNEGRICREDEVQPRTNLHYFYSVKDKKCKLFFAHGCGGNANRFEKKRDCEQLCMSVASS